MLVRNRVVNGRAWTELVVFCSCMAFTSIFELIEFGAALALGASSNAFLGSQGDIWDAQWDMLLCGLGAVLSIVFLSRLHRQWCSQLSP